MFSRQLTPPQIWEVCSPSTWTRCCTTASNPSTPFELAPTSCTWRWRGVCTWQLRRRRWWNVRRRIRLRPGSSTRKWKRWACTVRIVFESVYWIWSVFVFPVFDRFLMFLFQYFKDSQDSLETSDDLNSDDTWNSCPEVKSPHSELFQLNRFHLFVCWCYVRYCTLT